MARGARQGRGAEAPRGGRRHKNKDLPDDPAIIDQTRQYLLDAQRLLEDKPAPRAYFDAMITLYPDRLNLGPVWYTAVALLPEESGK